VGPGGYQLGHFPSGFAEWNDRYRDGVRRYWRGDPAIRPEVAARLSGSGDLFDPRLKRPWSSVNYVACHDGATLQDVVSYNGRHNEANGEDNRDGAHDNLSSNYGVEGETADPVISGYRERVKRSLLATLFCSLGTPMLQMGDECGRTQQGNNNAYCQDNVISWFDWSLLEGEAGKSLADYVARLTGLRKRYATLRSNKFLGDAMVADGISELVWLDERGTPLTSDDWANPEGRALVLRRARKNPDGSVEITALMMNASSQELEFHLPGPYSWTLLFDTAHPEKQESRAETPTIRIADRSVVLMACELKH
jgi:glycogen operon protein